MTLTVATTGSQGGTGSNGNEFVLQIIKTDVFPSDAVYCHTHAPTFVRVSYSSAGGTEKQKRRLIKPLN